MSEIEDKWLNKTEMAAAIGISRPTLDAYLEMPGAPKVNRSGKFSLSKIRELIETHAKKESTLVAVSSDIKALKAREVLARCIKLEFDNEVTKGNYVETAEVRRDCTRYALAAKKALLSIPSKAPLLVGQDPSSIEEKLREWILEPLNMLASGQWVGCECPKCKEEIKL